MRKPLALLCCAALLMPFGLAQQNLTAAEPRLSSGSSATAILPSGTPIHMKLETGLSTAANKVGDVFTGRVTADVQNGGAVVIPVGSQITGHVSRSVEKRLYKGRPVLELRPEEVILPDGKRYQIAAVLTGVDRESGTSVDSEGQIKGGGMDGRDKVEVAAGTGGGALMGGLIGRSGKGTLVGAMVGGGAAIAYWLSKTKSASLTAGTEIVMELARPMTLQAAGD
jgi:hypothetical protein